MNAGQNVVKVSSIEKFSINNYAKVSDFNLSLAPLNHALLVSQVHCAFWLSLLNQNKAIKSLDGQRKIKEDIHIQCQRPSFYRDSCQRVTIFPHTNLLACKLGPILRSSDDSWANLNLLMKAMGCGCKLGKSWQWTMSWNYLVSFLGFELVYSIFLKVRYWKNIVLVICTETQISYWYRYWTF